jgi:hypothetical protein
VKKGYKMRIVDRKEFLSLEDPVLYTKCDEWGNAEDLHISYGRSSEGSNDFVTVGLHSFVKEWCGSKSPNDSGEMFETLKKAIDNKDAHFEWDYSMTGRDGLYDEDQLFMIYEKLDLLKLMRELNKIYEHQYQKDEYRCKYEIY